jgi:hypothetical protein
MALYESPLSPNTLKAALNAGAFYLADWLTTIDTLYAVAQAAGRGEHLLPSGVLGETVLSLLFHTPSSNQILRLGGLTLDLKTCEATLDNTRLDLYPKSIEY